MSQNAMRKKPEKVGAKSVGRRVLGPVKSRSTPAIQSLNRLADAADIEALWNKDANDRPGLVVMPIDVWDEISDRLEDAQDAGSAAAPRGFAVPGEVVEAEINGTHPVAAWREYRGLRYVTDLARATGISAAYLRDIEAGRKPGSVHAYGKISKALDVPIDVLVGSED